MSKLLPIYFLQGSTVLEEALQVVNLEKGGQNQRTALNQGPHHYTACCGLIGCRHSSRGEVCHQKTNERRVRVSIRSRKGRSKRRRRRGEKREAFSECRRGCGMRFARIRTVSETHFSHLEVFLLSLEVGEGSSQFNDLITERRQLLFLGQFVHLRAYAANIPFENDIFVGKSGHGVAEADGKGTVNVRVESIAAFGLLLSSQDVGASRSIDLQYDSQKKGTVRGK